MKRKHWLILIGALSLVLIIAACTFTGIVASADTGDVAGAVQNTWNDAQGQIKQVVNNVIFPVVDLILAVMFFIKLGMAYFDYRKHGQFEFVAPCILFACLIFTLTAPLYIWDILGM
ncbi:MAG: DUF3852 domain-containing protein [Clostridiales bacterium]|nr:DUF3852 domain-containing protein [Clostridiales bacterium]